VDDRDAILSQLPDAVGGERPTSRVALRSVPSSELWNCFVERLTALGGEVKSLSELSGFRDRAFIDGDVPEAARAMLGHPVEDVWAAEAGVTLCEVAAAETGSVLVASGPGRSRLASLAPPVHIVLVRPSVVAASLEEAFMRVPPRTCWLVTGPSRTADIEGVLVRGVHGPKRLWVVLIPE
jgi:hypothetical protein